MFNFIFSNKVCDTRRIHQNFTNRNTPTANFWHQKLRNNATQSHCKLHTNLRLLIGWKIIDNAVNGLRRIVGMNG